MMFWVSGKCYSNEWQMLLQVSGRKWQKWQNKNANATQAFVGILSKTDTKWQK